MWLYELNEAGRKLNGADTLIVHSPPQEDTAAKPWRNAQRVSSEALAKEDMLRRVSPKSQKGPRL
jgi:hypothetical protein